MQCYGSKNYFSKTCKNIYFYALRKYEFLFNAVLWIQDKKILFKTCKIFFHAIENMILFIKCSAKDPGSSS